VLEPNVLQQNAPDFFLFFAGNGPEFYKPLIDENPERFAQHGPARLEFHRLWWATAYKLAAWRPK
jgi:hypothetical protein